VFAYLIILAKVFIALVYDITCEIYMKLLFHKVAARRCHAKPGTEESVDYIRSFKK